MGATPTLVTSTPVGPLSWPFLMGFLITKAAEVAKRIKKESKRQKRRILCTIENCVVFAATVQSLVLKVWLSLSVERRSHARNDWTAKVKRNIQRRATIVTPSSALPFSVFGHWQHIRSQSRKALLGILFPFYDVCCFFFPSIYPLRLFDQEFRSQTLKRHTPCSDWDQGHLLNCCQHRIRADVSTRWVNADTSLLCTLFADHLAVSYCLNQLSWLRFWTHWSCVCKLRTGVDYLQPPFAFSPRRYK